MKVGIQGVLILKNDNVVYFRRNIFTAIFLSASIFFCNLAFAGNNLHYEPVVVTLEGYITIHQFDGPPNYGEGPNDKKVDVPVLNLSEPVNVSPAGDVSDDDPDNQEEKNIKILQIVNYKKDMKINGCYRVTGTLMHQITADHYTPVLIVMQSFEPSSVCK